MTNKRLGILMGSIYNLKRLKKGETN